MSVESTAIAPDSSSSLQEFKQGYKALIASLIGAGCGISSVCFYTNSVFVAAIDTDMPWSRGEIQIGISIMILAAIFTAPLTGMLIDRFGARAVALTSMPLFTLSLVGLSFVGNDVRSFYAGWVVMSVLAAGTLPITWTKVVNQWFDRSRGLALGLTLMGTGIAAAVAPKYAAWLIGEYGWRNAYALLGVTVLVISFVPLLLFFFEFGHAGKPQQQSRESESAPAPKTGLTLKQALKGYKLWALCIALLCVAVGISGVITNLVPILTDKGLTVGEAAGYAGLVGISVIAGRLLAGFLMDRLWAPAIAALFLFMPLISAILLKQPALSDTQMALAALIVGLAAGAELDIMAYLISRYFGLAYYGSLYGFLYIFFSIGAGVAPVIFGWAFDVSGNYNLTLSMVAVLSVVGALLIVAMGKYPVLQQH
ncbi:MFS transporter [Alteromonas lipolytica]|uniref:Major facilitator superfamily (MFS) profile domain-containing protein n=1 Tax=Alteromonas lipolytica TaxID=1856405 RepID=A0A1E8FJ67_9ALTE|nr:MFS transporter [Alteromonas lipolytica]OFI35658.1 hypothetical protein BFC17_12960 [Alteromonas lipolytica]GGF77967.1 MFS transporter [Alteromonas lipolytica]